MAVSKLDEVVSLAKRRGFVFPAGEIYGGTRSAWDYGPLGVALKDNIKREWWRSMVVTRGDVVGVDTSIILPTPVWVASGHVAVFNDPLVECLNCHKRQRSDKLEESYAEKHGDKLPENGMADIVCPDCGTRGKWTEPRDFNMMLRTHLGPVEDENSLHYLRPETAQGIFVDFKPGEDEAWHQYWIDARTQWYLDLGVKPENLRHYEHPKEKLAHYSKRTVDIEYKFGFQGSDWGELEGIANRTDFDLSAHAEHSGEDLSYFNQATGEKYVPYVIEPAAGLTRSLMCFLVDAYDVDEAPNTKGGVDKRTVLHLDPRLAPVKAAVLPLSKKPDLQSVAQKLAAARSAVVTVVKTRSAPRCASPSTSTPLTTRPSPSVNATPCSRSASASTRWPTTSPSASARSASACRRCRSKWAARLGLSPSRSPKPVACTDRPESVILNGTSLTYAR